MKTNYLGIDPISISAEHSLAESVVQTAGGILQAFRQFGWQVVNAAAIVSRPIDAPLHRAGFKCISFITD